MALYAIGDLHLSLASNKPMDVFGAGWTNYVERIREGFSALTEDDVTVLCGDLSWAMGLEESLEDFRFIDALPGRKYIIKGNHDYWWGGVGQVRRALPDGMMALQHDVADLGDLVVTGTRGWTFPTEDTPLSKDDERIFNRELIRLELALTAAQKAAAGRPVLLMLHYPPLYQTERDTAFTRLIEQYQVHTVVYGHLHGAGLRAGFNGTWNGVRYMLTSCDALGFRLAEVVMTENPQV